MDTAHAFPGQRILGSRQRNGNRLFLGMERAVDILQVHVRGMPGLLRNAQEPREVARVQRVSLARRALVLRKEMDGAQDGTVADLSPQLRDRRAELSFGHVAQDGFAEECGNRSHFKGNRGVFVRQVGMVRARVDDAERVPRLREIIIDLVHLGAFDIREVNRDRRSDRRRHLVHQPAGLPKIHILGILSNLRQLHRRQRVMAEQVADDNAHHHLIRRRGRQTGAAEYIGADVSVEAADGIAQAGNLGGNAAHQRRRRIALALVRDEVGQRDL